MPPAVVIRPQMEPRASGRPRPLNTPSSESASAKPMLTPAPIDAASPTMKASQLLAVAKAAAKTGARVEIEPSMSPTSPGCTICRTNRRFSESSSFARAPEAFAFSSISSARS